MAWIMWMLLGVVIGLALETGGLWVLWRLDAAQDELDRRNEI